MTNKGEGQRPVLGVSVLVVDNGRVLLVQRGHEPLKGYWSLPGGHVEGGERLAEAAAREVHEETGVTVDNFRQINMAEIVGRDGDGGVTHHYVIVIFAGRHRSGEPRPGDDAAEARFVAIDEVAGLKMTEDTRRMIVAYRNGKAHNDA